MKQFFFIPKQRNVHLWHLFCLCYVKKRVLKVLSASLTLIFLVGIWDFFSIHDTFVFYYLIPHEMLAYWTYYFFPCEKWGWTHNVNCVLFINYLLQVNVACRTVDGVLAFLIGLCCANLFTAGQHNVRYLGSFPASLSCHGWPWAKICTQISTYSGKVAQFVLAVSLSFV